MNCTKCGAPMQPDQVFCPSCGQPVQVLPGTAPDTGKAKKTLFWAPGAGGAPGMGMPPGVPVPPTPPAAPPAAPAPPAPAAPAAPVPTPAATPSAGLEDRKAAAHAPTLIATPGMLPNFMPPPAAGTPASPGVAAPVPPAPTPAAFAPPAPIPAPAAPVPPAAPAAFAPPAAAAPVPPAAPAAFAPPAAAPAPVATAPVPPAPAAFAPPAAASSGIPQHFQEAFQLLPGESIQYFIEGDGFFLGTTLFLKIAAKMQAFFTFLTGGHIRIGFLLTNQRLLFIQSVQACCGMSRHKSVQTIALASIMEAASGKERQCMCLNTRVLHVQSRTAQHSFVAKNFDDIQLQEFITRMSDLIQRNAR